MMFKIVKALCWILLNMLTLFWWTWESLCILDKQLIRKYNQIFLFTYICRTNFSRTVCSVFKYQALIIFRKPPFNCCIKSFLTSLGNSCKMLISSHLVDPIFIRAPPPFLCNLNNFDMPPPTPSHVFPITTQ